MNRAARALRFLGLVGGLIIPPLSASAQGFSIDWFTIDAGGGTSSGGAYAFSGTIGQPDAGRLAGGPFALQGGFWSLVASIQAPELSIRRTLNTVIISWPSGSLFSGFELEDNPTLGASTWSNVTTAPVVIGGRSQVTIPAPEGNRFYRLSRSLP